MSPYVRSSWKFLIAIAMLLAATALLSAQTVTYTLTGTLTLVPGDSDPLKLSGTTVTAVATVSQTDTPSSTSVNSTSAANTYTSGVSVSITATLFGATTTLPCTSSASAPLALVITDNVGASDQLAINNCSLAGLATLSASATIPDGNLISDVPANIPSTPVTGNVGANAPALGITTAFTLAGTLIATGAAPPAVIPSPTAWTPSTTQGSTVSLTQPVTFTTSLAGATDSFTTSVSTTSGGNWLSVAPGALNTSSGITITVNPTGLAAAVYNGSVSLNFGTSGVAPVAIPVTFTILGPSLTLTSSSLAAFSYTLGTAAPASQLLTINTSPTSSTSVSASVTSGSSWLSVSPGSGTTPANFTVSINTAGITAPGTLSGNIQVTASGVTNSPLNVPVTLNVSSATLTVSTSPLTFNYTIGGTAPSAQAVSIGGTSGISFSVAAATTSGGSWLSATPSGTTVPASVSVAVNTTGLAAGSYKGTVTVTATGASGSPAVIPITLNVTGPTLTVNPTSLTFNYQIGGAAPSSQGISVGGTTGTSFTASASTSSGGSWLSVTGSGTVPQSISVTANPTGLGAGTYYGMVTVSATGATSQVVNVTFTVTMPTLTVTTNSLNFGYQIGNTAPSAQSVLVSGTAGLAFTATPATTSGGSWLSVNPTSGTTGNSISVSVNVTGLAANTYSGTVTISASGATSQVINVTLVVSSAPTITANPTLLNFTYTTGGTAPAAQSVAIGGSSGLAFTATPATTSGGSWLSVNPTSGTTPSSVSVSVSTTGLSAGTYNGSITVAASGATSQVVSVSLVITSTPTITANPTLLNFTYTTGGTAPAPQSVAIGGSSGLAFTATPATTSGGNWLSVNPTSGTSPSSISVSVSTSGLSAGTYSGSVTIAATGATSQVVSVSLVVSSGSTTVTATPSSLSFTYTMGSAAPAAQPVSVSGPSESFALITAPSWLSATPTSGTLPTSLSVSVNPAGLVVGTYSGTITVMTSGSGATSSIRAVRHADGGGPSPLGAVTITVSLTVSATPTVTATPSSVSFAFMTGGPTPSSQPVTFTSAQPVSISAAVQNASWLSANLSSSTTPATLTTSVNTAGLSAGTYHGSIVVSSPGAANATQTISVSMVVSAKPMFAPSPASLVFSAPTGGSNPAAQSINLGASGSMPFTISTSAGWLGVSASSSTSPSTLVASVNTKGMNAGSYQGAITVTSASAASPLSIPVALTLTAAQAVAGPSITSVVNGASYDASKFSPGAIVSIFGNQLGPETGATFSVDSKGNVDSTLSGVNVTVNGVPAIPLYVQNGQVNAILPFTLATSGNLQVQVQYNNLTSAEFTVPLTAADVQIFTANGSGSGEGSILNQDYSVNTATNPAAKGSVLQVYGTGGGLLTPAAVAGSIAGDTLGWVALPYSATVNGENAKVLYAGSAPSLVYGVYQFNVEVPADAPSGAVKIVLTVGGVSSQSDVTVFVK